MSFDKLEQWPVSYFKAFSQWLLTNRKTLPGRINAINAQLETIGFVKVLYRTVDDGQGGLKATEDRVGISVSKDSTLEKLMQAYIFQGGNPFDISPFMIPDLTEVISIDPNGQPVFKEQYPYGGVAAARSVDYNSPVNDASDTGYGDYQGGYIQFDRYYPARLGGRIHPPDLQITKVMRSIRDWANQDIKNRLQMLEWKIIKQMDLREQLITERDEILVQAFGGFSDSVSYLDEERMNPDLNVINLINDMYSILYENTYPFFKAKGEIGFLDHAFKDVVSEITHPLGG
jgi:hypothetical protein